MMWAVYVLMAFAAGVGFAWVLLSIVTETDRALDRRRRESYLAQRGHSERLKEE